MDRNLRKRTSHGQKFEKCDLQRTKFQEMGP